jgi:hypothetical protein
MDSEAKLRDAIEDVEIEGINDSSTFGVIHSEVLHADLEGGEHFNTLLEGTPIPKTMREVKPHDRETQQMRLVHGFAREHPIYRSIKQEGIIFASGVHDGVILHQGGFDVLVIYFQLTSEGDEDLGVTAPRKQSSGNAVVVGGTTSREGSGSRSRLGSNDRVGRRPFISCFVGWVRASDPDSGDWSLIGSSVIQGRQDRVKMDRRRHISGLYLNVDRW